MRLTALVLGIIGGIGGFIISFLILIVGRFVVLISDGNGSPFGPDGADTYVWMEMGGFTDCFVPPLAAILSLH